ncbi:MAG: glycosyltransferase [Komarekiella atlantica HA4396-MV6]|jgi:glycosyltransferase involved in cell wall biosynthesis|nr:glycosyltransferase [Komarekiella atlantica HA4396-MV6]
MNIHIYLPQFPAFGDKITDGMTKSIHGLSSGLASHGVQVTILCEGKEDSFFQSNTGYAIKCFAHKNKSHKFEIPSGLKQYIAQEIKNSIIIINGIFYLKSYLLSRLCKKNAIPYIIAPHDPYHPSIFNKNAHLKWSYWYLIEKRLLQQANAIQVLDIRHAKWLERLNVHTLAIETPNGFSPDDVHSESSLSWTEVGIPKLLFLGRIDAHNKGLDILIDAFKEVLETIDAKLFIQGPDWGDKNKLQKRATQLSILEKVSFVEPNYNQSSSSIIAEYDIFCLASRFEGFSLAALEAMLAGRVLLVSEVAGIANYVQASGCGVVVKPDVLSIKEGLVKLLKSRPNWQEMGLRGRRYALEHLQWNQIAGNALEDYKTLIK